MITVTIIEGRDAVARMMACDMKLNVVAVAEWTKQQSLSMELYLFIT